LSDFLNFILKNVIQYRKKIIYDNLKNSFPEKTSAEIIAIQQKTYKNLCDITLESIKGLTMSGKDLRERYKILNPEILTMAFRQKESVILVGAHYGNWEWGVRSWSLWFQHQVIGIYKPLANKTVESYLNLRREDFGMHLAGPKETRKALELSSKEPCMYVLFGDQTPHNLNTCHWLSFLNQDTAWLQGVGEIAHQRNFMVYYLDTQRVRRGFYESELIPLCLNPKEQTPQVISEKYAQQVEKIIQTKPEDWLWSHKRWKHKRIV
jgi:KDO2-lipid IV(A) lauroyltransferase